MDAALGGHAEAVKTLLDAGADVNAKDYYGGSALLRAELLGHANIVDLLLTAGAKRGLGK